MLVMLSLGLGLFAGVTVRGAAFSAIALAIVACWLTAAVVSAVDPWALVVAVLLYNCGLGLSLVSAVFMPMDQPESH